MHRPVIGAIRSSATSRGARPGAWRRPLAAAGLVTLAAARLSGQETAPYPAAAVDNAGYHEQLGSDVVSRSGNATVHRVLRREARFAVSRQGDTVIVSADSLQMTAVTGSDTTRLDTGGFIGGRWHLLLTSDGRARVLERPFVPGALGEVNDLGAAMDDFFPRRPPDVAIGAAVSDLSGRQWRRLADSGAVRRYHWTIRQTLDSTRYAGDSVRVPVHQQSTETGSVAWRPDTGPLAWSRRIASTISTRVNNRTIDATVTETITVRRMP